MIKSSLLKLGASFINIVIVAIFCVPLWYVDTALIYKKLFVIMVFFLYNFVFLLRNHNRCLGMMLIGTQYSSPGKSFAAHFMHNILYTLSFATLLFWVWFPGDVFLINMMLIQLPFIFLTGKTLHGFVLEKL